MRKYPSILKAYVIFNPFLVKKKINKFIQIRNVNNGEIIGKYLHLVQYTEFNRTYDWKH